MHRLSVEQPFAPLALWCRRLALFALFVAGIGVSLAKSGLVDPLSSLAVLVSALLMALLAVLFGFLSFVSIWRSGRRGAGIALGGLAMACLLLAFPIFSLAQAIRLPVQNDASTDLVDPPSFSRSAAALSARAGHVPGDLRQDWREAQRRIWPDLQPIVVNRDMPEAWALVQATVSALNWRVIEQEAPGERQGQARLEAIDYTPLFRFPDDIAIRLRSAHGQTHIDMRSVSRFGQHDLGMNAKRIREFSSELQVQLGAK